MPSNDNRITKFFAPETSANLAGSYKYSAGIGARALTADFVGYMLGVGYTPTDVSVHISNSTWYRPVIGNWVMMICIGGGQGGTGGGRAPTASVTGIGGGAGGSGGSYSIALFQRSELPTTLSVTVGSGGSGSTGASTAGSSASSSGVSGGSSLVYALNGLTTAQSLLGNMYCIAQGGGVSPQGGTYSSNAGGATGSLTANTAPSAPFTRAAYQPNGGGAGGQVAVVTGVRYFLQGANGGLTGLYIGNFAGGTGGSGTAGSAGTSGTAGLARGGSGGGGGGAGNGVNGYNGGAGGAYGAGGGGGGACYSATAVTGGTGGAGGAGFVQIITW
jgi:hypothetical protein